MICILIHTDDIPCRYFTSPFILKMCLACIDHSHLYWRCASLVLHILICTEDVPDLYCSSSLVLHILSCISHQSPILYILARTAHIYTGWVCDTKGASSFMNYLNALSPLHCCKLSWADFWKRPTNDKKSFSKKHVLTARCSWCLVDRLWIKVQIILFQNHRISRRLWWYFRHSNCLVPK